MKRLSVPLLGWVLLGAVQIWGLLIGWRTPELVSSYAWSRPGFPWLLLIWLVLGLILWRVPTSFWRRLLFDSSGKVFYGTLAVLGFALYVLVSHLVYGGVPRIDDGVAAVFQSKIFLSGHLVLPPPPEPDFFRLNCTIGPWSDTDHGLNWWCSMYPPGWSTVAMPFVATGTERFFNPMLGGFLIVAVGWLGRALFNPRTGRVAALMMLGSPFLAAIAGTHLSHVLTALCITICAASVWRLISLGDAHGHSYNAKISTGLGWGALAGLAFHLAFVTRPVTTLMLGGLIGIMVLARWRSALRVWHGVILAGIIGAAAAGTLGWYQANTTGDWKTAGHHPGMGKWGKLGFGVVAEITETDPLGWKHTPTKSVRHSLGRLQGADKKAIGWPIGLFALCLLPWALRLEGRWRWKVVWLTCFPLLLLSFFALFWYEEVYWRGRYLFAGLPFLILPAAWTFAELAGARANRGWRAFLAFGAAFVIAVALPAELLKFGLHHGDVESHLVRLVEQANIGKPGPDGETRKAIVFVKAEGLGSAEFDGKNDFFATGFMQNDIALENDILYVQDLGERNPELLRHFPDREPYYYLLDRILFSAELSDASGRVLSSAFPNAQ